jgi:hypothetical protein
MKKQLFSFLLLVLLFTGVPAQKAKQGKEEKRLRTHVTYLASDRLEGRRTGETGATYAAGYVANTFANYKLKTASSLDSKSYLQSFPYITGVELANDNLLKINNSQLNLKTDWMPIGFSAGGKLANAPVVFAGFGITSAELKYDSYEDLDIRNKIALVFEGAPEGDQQFARLADARVKAKIAADKGASGFIIISGDSDFSKSKFATLDYDQVLGESSIPAVVISRAAASKLLGEADEKGLDELEKWIAMRKDAPKSIDIKLANRPKLTAELNVNLPKTTAQGYNVIGVLPGRDLILKDEAIIIGAHYDHLGHGGKGSLDVNSKAIHHGADDNASGVSAMLELARQFKKSKNNRRTLIFIAFGGEEEGLLGSKFYVNNPLYPLEKTVAMINMDMVGRLKDNKLTIGGIGTADVWKDLVTNLNRRVPDVYGKNKSLSFAPNPEEIDLFELQLNEDGFGPSDHSSFYGKQIPVLFFFTGTHSDYHKPSDTSDKINYAGIEKIENFVGDIVRSIDSTTARPVYKAAKSSGMGEGRRGFNVSLGTVPSYADNTNDGLALDGVRDDSPAATAGIKAGDKIIKMAGHDIKNISDYVFVLGEMKAGEEYEVIVIRGAEKLTLKIIPVARK